MYQGYGRIHYNFLTFVANFELEGMSVMKCCCIRFHCICDLSSKGVSFNLDWSVATLN